MYTIKIDLQETCYDMLVNKKRKNCLTQNLTQSLMFCQQNYNCLKLCGKCTFTVELERSMEIDRLDFGR